MKKLLIRLITATVLVLASMSPAASECFAEYKAKKDDPLRLHYGVIQIPDGLCSREGAGRYIAARISVEGWSLLAVGRVFGPAGLNERKRDAGQYFLRY